MNHITPDEVRNWFTHADEDVIDAFLDEGLHQLIEQLEGDDFFGTEGFDKRFA